MVSDEITVIIPHIPFRHTSLAYAIKSVWDQLLQPTSVIVEVDVQREGSAVTRNRALERVRTPWVAFLDDDDVFMPHHLRTLLKTAKTTGADVIYPGCRVVNPALGGEISLRDEWGRFGKEFDAELLKKQSYIPVTSLVRTGLARLAQFGPPETHPESHYDDWGFYLRLLNLGAIFKHAPVITWTWNHHGNNTSGQADRW